MLYFNHEKFDFWKVYDSIKHFYPIGIKKDESKIYFSHPGLKELENIIVDNIHDDNNFNSRWEAFTKKIERQIGKEIIEISLEQMQQMAGNILELKNTDGQPKIVMSKTAFNAFTEAQRKQLEKFGDLIVVEIDTIEKIGGGSARCMLGEIFYV